jgi:hypothetical protein
MASRSSSVSGSLALLPLCWLSVVAGWPARGLFLVVIWATSWLAWALLDAVGMGPDFDSRLAKSVGAFCDCRFIPYVGRVVQQLPVEGKDSEMR